MRKVRRFLELEAGEKTLFLFLVLFFPVLRAGLRLLGLGRLQSLMGLKTSPGESREGAAGLEEARRVNYVLQAAVANGLIKPTCLERSLVLVWLLRRRGIAGDLHIGVRPSEEGVDAHAWVECGGAVVNDSESVRENYAAFHNPL